MRSYTGLFRRSPIVLLMLVLAVAILPTRDSRAAPTALPSGFTQTRIASGLSNPTAMAFAPGGRLFVLEQAGRVRVISFGNAGPRLLATPFLDISWKVDDQAERGLLGIAFDPNFRANRYVYLYYTRARTSTTPVHNRVVRVTANGNVAVSGSEKLIFRLDNLSSATNHNGGAIHFRGDGKLYIAVGDNANRDNAQSLATLHGKILRINKDGSIPTDNPFYNRTGARRAIWALGLRNPYTFAFQRGIGKMYINDVGQNTWEEINRGYAGSNYGWPYYEGYESASLYRSPVHAYSHGGAPYACAITGGAFYNPPTVQFPSRFVGSYFFADYCAGWIKRLYWYGGRKYVAGFHTGASQPVDLAVRNDGTLFYLEHSGSVWRVGYNP